MGACGRWWVRPALLVLALAAAPAFAGPPAEPLHGRLSAHQGLPVLEVWGTPEQAGYAHGYLLAERIVPLFDGYVLNERLMPNPATYDAVLRPTVRRQFIWDERYEAELRGLARGIRDKVGAAGFRSEQLGRELDVDDLLVANALADWYGLLCSSFSAWGPLTADGQTLTARNLDFPAAGGMERLQIILVHRGAGQPRPWAGMTWPGLIGVFTGLNAEGVTMLAHDAPGLPAAATTGFTPRGLILREALAAAGPETFSEDVHKVLRSRRVLVGNNIHVSGPRRGPSPPAVVFEYDGNERDGGVTVRLPEAAGAAAAPPALWCTNHMCRRQAPIRAERYEHLTRRLGELTAAGRTLDPPAALRLIQEVRQSATLHSVVLEPARRVMWVHVPAVTADVVEFRLAEWLARPVEAGNR